MSITPQILDLIQHSAVVAPALVGSADAHASSGSGAKWGAAMAVFFGLIFLNGPADGFVKLALVAAAVVFFITNKPAAGGHH